MNREMVPDVQGTVGPCAMMPASSPSYSTYITLTPARVRVCGHAEKRERGTHAPHLVFEPTVVVRVCTA